MLIQICLSFNEYLFNNIMEFAEKLYEHILEWKEGFFFIKKIK